MVAGLPSDVGTESADSNYDVVGMLFMAKSPELIAMLKVAFGESDWRIQPVVISYACVVGMYIVRGGRDVDGAPTPDEFLTHAKRWAQAEAVGGVR